MFCSYVDILMQVEQDAQSKTCFLDCMFKMERTEHDLFMCRSGEYRKSHFKTKAFYF